MAEAPDVQAEALDTLVTWLQGYTTPDDEHRQWKLRLHTDESHHLEFSAEPTFQSYDRKVRWYRVEVNVTEIEPPHDTAQFPAVEMGSDDSWFFGR